jgi:hypothetical protein
VLANVLHELRNLQLLVEVLATGSVTHIAATGLTSFGLEMSEICPGFLSASTTFSATSTVVVSPKAGWPGRSKRSQRPPPLVKPGLTEVAWTPVFCSSVYNVRLNRTLAPFVAA